MIFNYKSIFIFFVYLYIFNHSDHRTVEGLFQPSEFIFDCVLESGQPVKGNLREEMVLGLELHAVHHQQARTNSRVCSPAKSQFGDQLIEPWDYWQIGFLFLCFPPKRILFRILIIAQLSASSQNWY